MNWRRASSVPASTCIGFWDLRLLEKIYGGLLLNVNVAILQNGMKRTVL